MVAERSSILGSRDVAELVRPRLADAAGVVMKCYRLISNKFFARLVCILALFVSAGIPVVAPLSVSIAFMAFSARSAAFERAFLT